MVVNCQCSICRNGGKATKPAGCQCPGDSHVNIMCFVTKTVPRPCQLCALGALRLPSSTEGSAEHYHVVSVGIDDDSCVSYSTALRCPAWKPL